MDTEFLTLETYLEEGSRTRLRLSYERLLRQRTLVARLSAADADRPDAEQCLQQMEHSFQVLSEIWELRLAALDSMISVREAFHATEGFPRTLPPRPQVAANFSSANVVDI